MKNRSGEKIKLASIDELLGVQVAFLFVLSVILYLILFAGVFVDTVLDMTRESIIDFILS